MLNTTVKGGRSDTIPAAVPTEFQLRTVSRVSRAVGGSARAAVASVCPATAPHDQVRLPAEAPDRALRLDGFTLLEHVVESICYATRTAVEGLLQQHELAPTVVVVLHGNCFVELP